MVDLSHTSPLPQVVRITADGTYSMDDTCNALLALLSSELSQCLRVVVLHICGGTFESTTQSSLVSQLDAVIRRLSSKGVVVVCTAHGHVTGAALLLVAAAHYRIVDAGVCFACDSTGEVAQCLRAVMHTDDASSFLLEGSISAARAHDLSFVSEVVTSDLDTRALQFASWIISQSQVGLVYVLGLTLRDSIAQERDMHVLGERWRLWRTELTDTAFQSSLVSPELVESKAVVSGGASTKAAAVRELISSQSASRSPVLELPQVERPGTSRHAGIHALEVYTPRLCGSAAELKRAHGCVGKYAEGLLMRQYATCDEDEDVVTMALTVVSRLVEAHGLRYEDIGMLQVGSESLLDRSKSIKSHLMRLFEASGNHNVEGIDSYQACYGGTAALLTCTNWVESEAYDGRWAIAVTTDVSEGTKQYPFMNGAAAVAMLVGPDAPLALDGKCVTHMVHEWDFYKPVGWRSVHPMVDGPHSMQVYFGCLRTCQAKMAAAGEGVWVDSHDHLVFHLGSSAKFVKHAFEEAIANAHGDSVDEVEVASHFELLVLPSLQLAQRIGPMHTSATYANLCSLLLHASPAVGARIGVFSYGSGAACSMHHLRVRGSVRVDTKVMARLDARVQLSAGEFGEAVERYVGTYCRFGWSPFVSGAPVAPSFRIKAVDALGRREYEHLALTRLEVEPLEGREVVQGAAAGSGAPAEAGLQQLLTLLSNQTKPAEPAIDVGALVQETVSKLAGSDVSADAPLMEAGLDSLGATEFQSRLSQRLGVETMLPDTLIFDFPTLRQIEAHVVTLLPATHAAAPAAAVGGITAGLMQLFASKRTSAPSNAVPVHQASRAACPALTGMSQSLPGGVTATRALWHMTTTAHDSVAEVPTARWSAEAATSEADPLGRTRHGGFISGAQLFNNHAFSISAAEALAADPQQRLLLESSYAALHQAGNRREALLGSGTGAAVGIYATEFGQILQQSPLRSSVYAATCSLSIASGRISFVLGLHGPCTSYETACSASLVAGHSALRALRHGDCKLHLAAGVNLMLLQASSEVMAVAGMTSKEGKSHTFDRRADGFARGEGCAIVVLESKEDNTATRLGGSAVRQDGRSASLTAPNGQAQQGLLRAALADAGASVESVAETEAHGTGTALGDPVEVGALTGIVLSARPATCAPVGVSSVKANIGHTESTAGQVGLVRLVVGLEWCGAPPNAQLRALNLHLRSMMMRSSCVMPTQQAVVGALSLELGSEQGVGGVSSFGYSGTIAHAVLRTRTMTSVPLPQPRNWLVFHRRLFSWLSSRQEEPLLALSSLRLTGRLTCTAALGALNSLPIDAPVLIETQGLYLDSSLELVDRLSRQQASIVLLCVGALGGAGALLLLDTATMAIGDTSCVVTVSTGSEACLARRGETAVRPGRYAASEVVLHTWFDSMYDKKGARQEAQRLVSRLSLIPHPLLVMCRTQLPVSSVDGALLVMGTLHPRPPRPVEARLVHVHADLDSRVAIVELHDPKRSNTMSTELAEDMSATVASVLRYSGTVRSVVLQGAGSHFSVGGNPYALKGAAMSLAALSMQMEAAFGGFFQLRGMQVPIVCAVHGKLIGGGIAIMMSADYIVADTESTFCHGNLVRGVCPIGMFSKALVITAGLSRSLHVYLSNDTLDAATAKRFRLVHATAAGVKVGQSHAREVATMLAAQEEQAYVLRADRLPYDALLVAAEAVGHARCCLFNGGYAPAALPDSYAAQAMQLHSTLLELAPQQVSTPSAPTVHVVEVPTTLTSNTMSGAWFQWPSNALLIFRGSGPGSFCLGEEPSAANISDGSFLDGVELFTQLHENIERAGMPTIVVCHGATRSGGMLFPCLGSVVLAHSDASFGFPEILGGALPSVVSVAARRRLGKATCERLFCTGDTVDAATAHQLGLVDFVGSKVQVEAYVARLTERCMALDPAWVSAMEQGPSVHQLPHDVSIPVSFPVETDGGSQVLPPIHFSSPLKREPEYSLPAPITIP